MTSQDTLEPKMRIVCPACETAYDVPNSLVEGRNQVRCARCGSDWVPGEPFAFAHEDEPESGGEIASDEPPEPDIETAAPMPALHADDGLRPVPSAPSRRAGGTIVAAAWAASILVLLVAGWGAVAYRVPVMKAWPPASRAYAALRLSGAAEQP